MDGVGRARVEHVFGTSVISPSTGKGLNPHKFKCGGEGARLLYTSKRVWDDPLNVQPASPKVRCIAFQASFTERGSQVQTFDYALYAKQLLGVRVIIISGDPINTSTATLVQTRWKNHFELTPQSSSWTEIAARLREQSCFDLYLCTHGKRSGPNAPVKMVEALMRGGVRVHIHAIFYGVVPWGSTFARVGGAIRAGTSDSPVVPLIVRPGELVGENMRQRLGIGENATVFCRHGGVDTFNIDIAKRAVQRVAKQRPDIYFVFLNTLPFAPEQPNLLHLPAIVTTEGKARFIRTCDAMLHARADGETFGLSVAEFSSHNKPVLTFCPKDICAKNLANTTKLGKWNQVIGKRRYQVWYEHARILGAKGLFYSELAELENTMLTFNRTAAGLRRDWNAYEQFVPEKVIGQFSSVFLQGDLTRGGVRGDAALANAAPY